MKVEVFSLGQLQANCYFVISDHDCIIIDPADDAAFLLEEISRRNLKPLALIATHGHFDHVMAAGEMQVALQTVPFYLHKSDEFLVKRLGETAKYFLGYDPGVVPPSSFNMLTSGEMKIGPFTFSVIETPGHTPGSCSFYLKKENILFSGDTLFRGSIGRYDFSYSDKSDLKNSIKTILKLPGSTVVYSGHGSQTSILAEQNIPLLFF